MIRPFFTIFSCPKPFVGTVGVQQLNAIRSWECVGANIFLVGNEEGVSSVAWAMDAVYQPEVEYNDHHTPLVNSVFRLGVREAVTDVVAYVNADIILLDDFRRAVKAVAGAIPGPFMMVGRRTDLVWDTPLDMRAGWDVLFRQHVGNEGTLHQPAGIDYFVFRRNTLFMIPPFALGRFRWDNWLVWKALTEGWSVVDATADVLAVHQDHGYEHTRQGNKHDAYNGPECRQNTDLARETGCSHWCTTDDATHILKNGVVVRKW